MAMEDHAVELRSRTLTPTPPHQWAQWEELGMRVESSARAGVFRRPSSVPELSARPVADRGLLRRMSSTFSAAGAVSLGVQEWPTDWRTDWATRRSFAPSSVDSVSSVSSVSSASSVSPVSSAATPANPRWQPTQKGQPIPNAARRDSLHSQEQECVMDMVCLI